jgi:hypothetical protein
MGLVNRFVKGSFFSVRRKPKYRPPLKPGPEVGD